MRSNFVDFLPADHRERRIRRRVRVVEISVFSIVVLAMGVATFVTRRDTTRLTGELDAVRAEHDEAGRRIAAVERLEQKKDELSRRMGVLKDVLARTRGALLLAVVGAASPEGTQLSHVILQRVEDGPAPKMSVTIEGVCPSYEALTSLVERLKATPWLDQAGIVVAEAVVDGEPQRKFVLAGSAPAVLAAPAGGQP